MAKTNAILLLEDEPLILMDLEAAAQDRGFTVFACACCEEALEVLDDQAAGPDAAVLDVSLGGGNTCAPVAEELTQRSIPYILHSGDLDRQDELIRQLDAVLVAKPAPAETVIEAAIVHANGNGPDAQRIAVE